MKTTEAISPAFFRASTDPLYDIARITYEGQDPNNRLYHSGYEDFFEQIPVMSPWDDFLDEKIALAKSVMKHLGKILSTAPWVAKTDPGPLGFKRNILALEEPLQTKYGPKEGSEIIIASWGDGFSSPIHGHADGYLHEEILVGKMRVNTYRITNKEKRIVRPISTTMETRGTFLSAYTMPQDSDQPRTAFVHNFTSIGFSASLHFIPEHTRDGRDNRFKVEYFDDYHALLPTEVKQITGKEAMYSRIGDVILVRSTNVPEYGDHYIVITGAPVMKEHGLRPQDVAIYAPTAKDILDKFEPTTGVTLLRLNDTTKALFHRFHGIEIDGGQVIFPKP